MKRIILLALLLTACKETITETVVLPPDTVTVTDTLTATDTLWLSCEPLEAHFSLADSAHNPLGANYPVGATFYVIVETDGADYVGVTFSEPDSLAGQAFTKHSEYVELGFYTNGAATFDIVMFAFTDSRGNYSETKRVSFVGSGTGTVNRRGEP